MLKPAQWEEGVSTLVKALSAVATEGFWEAIGAGGLLRYHGACFARASHGSRDFPRLSHQAWMCAVTVRVPSEMRLPETWRLLADESRDRCCG